MLVFVSVFLALCHHSISATYPHDTKSEKPLFVPTFNYATLVHLNPLPYGTSHSLDNTALYPQYVYDHGSHEYLDSFQRQLPYQDTEKRLESFLYAGIKPAKKHHLADRNEDDYKVKPNNILNLDEIKPELEDLDLKFKRSLTYTSWTPPSLSSTNNLEDRGAPSNSRAVPFGPYTTWLPYEGPLVTSYAPQNVKPTKAGAGNRRRRDVAYDTRQPLSQSYSDIPSDYAIPVPISYSLPLVRSGGPHYVPGTSSSSGGVTYYTGKLSASLDTVAQKSDPVSYSYHVVN